MTEQTQTTAERLRAMIFDAIQDSPYGDESIVAAPLGVTIAAEIDCLTAERDEAREQIAALEASNAEQAQMMADGFADAKEQSARLAEARAEVARLRPAADLGNAYLASIDEDADDNDIADLQDALEAAAARARLHKGNKS